MSELLGAGASVSLRDLGGQTALGAAFDGLQVRSRTDMSPCLVSLACKCGGCPAQAIAKYVEEALAEYSGAADKALENDMLARAAGPHIEVMTRVTHDT